MQINRINFRKQVNQIEPQCIFCVQTMRRRALRRDRALIVKNGKSVSVTRAATLCSRFKTKWLKSGQQKFTVQRTRRSFANARPKSDIRLLRYKTAQFSAKLVKSLWLMIYFVKISLCFGTLYVTGDERSTLLTPIYHVKLEFAHTRPQFVAETKDFWLWAQCIAPICQATKIRNHAYDWKLMFHTNTHQSAALNRNGMSAQRTHTLHLI